MDRRHRPTEIVELPEDPVPVNMDAWALDSPKHPTSPKYPKLKLGNSFFIVMMVFFVALAWYSAVKHNSGILCSGSLKDKDAAADSALAGIPTREIGEKQAHAESSCTVMVEERGISLWHFWSNEELLNKALGVKNVELMPATPMKIAFLFLVRSDVPHAGLWERYFKDHEGLYSVYIHTADPGKRLHDKSRVFWGRQIPSGDTSWGSAKLVDAERRMLANAYLDPFNERFILLSESCIPVRPFPALYNFLNTSEKSWVSSIYQTEKQAAKRWSESLLPVVPLEKFRKGWQWFELRRAHVLIVLEDLTYWDPIKDEWKHPEEHYLPSLFALLNIQDQISNVSLTFADWTSPGPHPHNYSDAEVTPELLGKIQSADGHTFFARKFGPDTVVALMDMGEDVLGF